MPRPGLWRPFFVLSGALLLLGGRRHPRGPMVEMLAHPDWVPSHALLFAGFVALLLGLALLRRDRSISRRTRRWLRAAAVGAAVQAFEMAVHTVAYIDHVNLAAGNPTPVLTTHLRLALVAYPVFGLTMGGFVVVATRERALGSTWIAWLGVLGALAHGAAAPLAALVEGGWPSLLFPGLLLLAAWLVLTGIWPRPSRSAAGAAAVPG